MKTITEFSGTVIRLAANAVAQTIASLPKEPEAPASVPVPAEPGAEGAPAPEAPVAAAPAVESEARRAAIEAALTKEVGVSGDRLARLREALELVGGKTADVRLVRVYAGDATVAGAKKHGDFQFVVDLMPQSTKPNFARPEKERGGRGGGGRGGRGASEGPPTGGFSMDSLKNDKGGRGGGGRGRPGGSKP